MTDKEWKEYIEAGFPATQQVLDTAIELLKLVKQGEAVGLVDIRTSDIGNAESIEVNLEMLYTNLRRQLQMQVSQLEQRIEMLDKLPSLLPHKVERDKESSRAVAYETEPLKVLLKNQIARYQTFIQSIENLHPRPDWKNHFYSDKERLCQPLSQ